ncbi:hypothetical protein J1605_020133 [Eschrichtius robustus]|uniref:Uncharacterized protein n=1 Tax=Eschrichtius robustus TaxID=9764 RepID=A0AB34HKR0_ESCRO|nr:hypothetical protein J1605_020133 [Eschrichtius robustus]
MAQALSFSLCSELVDGEDGGFRIRLAEKEGYRLRYLCTAAGVQDPDSRRRVRSASRVSGLCDMEWLVVVLGEDGDDDDPR